MVLNQDVIKAIAYTIITIIMLGLSIGIVLQSQQASCDKCLWTVKYLNIEQLSRDDGAIHPNDMLKDLKENGCELFNRLQ